MLLSGNWHKLFVDICFLAWWYTWNTRTFPSLYSPSFSIVLSFPHIQGVLKDFVIAAATKKGNAQSQARIPGSLFFWWGLVSAKVHRKRMKIRVFEMWERDVRVRGVLVTQLWKVHAGLSILFFIFPSE